jgi:hypothetical protein
MAASPSTQALPIPLAPPVTIAERILVIGLSISPIATSDVMANDVDN